MLILLRLVNSISSNNGCSLNHLSLNKRLFGIETRIIRPTCAMVGFLFSAFLLCLFCSGARRCDRFWWMHPLTRWCTASIRSCYIAERRSWLMISPWIIRAIHHYPRHLCRFQRKYTSSFLIWQSCSNLYSLNHWRKFYRIIGNKFALLRNIFSNVHVEAFYCPRTGSINR